MCGDPVPVPGPPPIITSRVVGGGKNSQWGQLIRASPPFQLVASDEDEQQVGLWSERKKKKTEGSVGGRWEFRTGLESTRGLMRRVFGTAASEKEPRRWRRRAPPTFFFFFFNSHFLPRNKLDVRSWWLAHLHTRHTERRNYLEVYSVGPDSLRMFTLK